MQKQNQQFNKKFKLTKAEEFSSVFCGIMIKFVKFI